MILHWTGSKRPGAYTIYGFPEGTNVDDLFDADKELITDNVAEDVPTYTVSGKAGDIDDYATSGTFSKFKGVKYLLLYADKISYTDDAKNGGSELARWWVTEAAKPKLMFDKNQYTVTEGQSFEAEVSEKAEGDTNQEPVTDGVTFSVTTGETVPGTYSDGKWHIAIDGEGTFSLKATKAGATESDAVTVVVTPISSKLAFDAANYTATEDHAFDVKVTRKNSKGEDVPVTNGITFSASLFRDGDAPNVKAEYSGADGVWHVTIDRAGKFYLTATKDGLEDSDASTVEVAANVAVTGIKFESDMYYVNWKRESTVRLIALNSAGKQVTLPGDAALTLPEGVIATPTANNGEWTLKFPDSISGDTKIGAKATGADGEVTAETTINVVNRLPLEAWQARYAVSNDYSRKSSSEDGDYLSFDIKISMPFDGEIPAYLEKVKSYKIEMHVDYENASFTKDAPVSWSTLDGTRHKLNNLDGSDYTYYAPNGSLTVEANDDGTMPVIFLDNVDPYWVFNFTATACDGDGNKVADIEPGIANNVSLTMPTVSYEASEMNITAIGEPLHVDKDKSHKPLGHRDDAPAYSTRASRVSTTNGWFSQIPLTDCTLRDWEVKVYLNLTFADPTDGNKKKLYQNVYAFNDMNDDKDGTSPYKTGKFVALNDHDGTRANISYLPLPVETKKAGELDLDGIANAPSDLTGQTVTVPKDDLTLTVETKAFMWIMRHEFNPLVNSEDIDMRPSMRQSTPIDNTVKLRMESGWEELIAAPNNAAIERMSIQMWSKNTWGGGKYVDAFPVIRFQPYQPENDNAALPFAVGYYASNGKGHLDEDYAKYCDLGGGVAGGEVNAQGQGYSEGNYINGYDKYTGGEYDAMRHNYAEISADKGHLPLRVHHVDDGTGVMTDANGKVTGGTDKISPLYALLLHEYPLSLARELNDKDGQRFDRAHPVVEVSSIVRAIPAIESAVAAAERAASGDEPFNTSMGAIDVTPDYGWSASYGASFQSVAAPALLYKSFAGTTTEISSVVSDETRKLEIYPNPVGDCMTVEGLNPDMPLEIYSVDGHCVLSTSTGDAAAKVDVSGVAPGYYVARCGNASAIMIKK